MKNLKDIILEHFENSKFSILEHVENSKFSILEHVENSKFSILERLHVNKDTKEIKPDDPSQWEVGDILAGTFGYTISCPVFYKIIKRTAKQFTVARIPGKIISGHRNGQWKEIADEKATPEKETINARINKNGNVIVDGVYVRLWDGTPLQGDDMD